MRMYSSLVTVLLLFTVGLKAQDSEKEKQYLLPEFVQSNVYYKQDAAVKQFMNYNLILDAMQYLGDDDKVESFYDFDKVDYIRLGHRHFVPLEIDFAEIIIETDKVALAIKRFTKVSGSSRNKVNKTLSKNEKLADNIVLISDSTYYLVRMAKPEGIKKGVFKGMALSQNRVTDTSLNGFMKVYADHKEKIREFVKEQEIDFKKPEDIIRLTEYCNGL